MVHCLRQAIIVWQPRLRHTDRISWMQKSPEELFFSSKQPAITRKSFLFEEGSISGKWNDQTSQIVFGPRRIQHSRNALAKNNLKPRKLHQRYVPPPLSVHKSIILLFFFFFKFPKQLLGVMICFFHFSFQSSCYCGIMHTKFVPGGIKISMKNAKFSQLPGGFAPPPLPQGVAPGPWPHFRFFKNFFQFPCLKASGDKAPWPRTGALPPGSPLRAFCCPHFSADFSSLNSHAWSNWYRTTEVRCL